MTLMELSHQYRGSARALQNRVQTLEARLRLETDELDRRLLEKRIHSLSVMWRESRDLAVLCERYYDRGYHINGRYTV